MLISLLITQPLHADYPFDLSKLTRHAKVARCLRWVDREGQGMYPPDFADPP